jgi:hypothetical protein
MLVAAVVNVRDSLEAGSEAAGNLLLADEATAPRAWASRRFEDTILCEARHDRVEVVLVPTSTIGQTLAGLAIGMEVVKRFRSSANGGSFSNVQEIDIG